MDANLLKLITVDREARLFVVDVTAPLRACAMGQVETEVAKGLYKKIYTHCALLRGLLTDEQRLSVILRFGGGAYSVHGEVDGIGHVHCTFSATMRAFDGDLSDLMRNGALLSITRGSWTGGMFTGTVELMTPEVDQFFSDFFGQSEQLETVFLSWTDHEPVRGCMIQPLPFARKDTVPRVLTQLRHIAPRLQAAEWEEVESIFAPFARVVERCAVHTHCRCSKEMLSGMLAAFDLNELEALSGKEEGVEIECGLCGRKYVYHRDDLDRILQLKRGTT